MHELEGCHSAHNSLQEEGTIAGLQEEGTLGEIPELGGRAQRWAGGHGVAPK